MKLLITGGTGYIGVHTCVELINDDYQVVVIDNLSNSSASAIEQVEKITNTKGKISFYQGDIRDRKLLQQIFKEHTCEAVIHLAGFKVAGESSKQPLRYYNNNIIGSIILFEEMEKVELKTVIFSSSAAVYGVPKTVPVNEDNSTGKVTSSYGRSKLFIEEILKDLYQSDPDWKISILRYFNPVGAHPSGLIGENPKGIPDNLMPYICQVASRKLEKLKIYGNDYPTKDGTGVRDFIHVVDLVKGHVAALNHICNSKTKHSPLIMNLGTGQGVSVLEMVRTFEDVTGETIPYEFVGRRKGDVAEMWASVKYVQEEIGWKAQRNIQQMCQDSWKWQQQC